MADHFLCPCQQNRSWTCSTQRLWGTYGEGLLNMLANRSSDIIRLNSWHLFVTTVRHMIIVWHVICLYINYLIYDTISCCVSRNSPQQVSHICNTDILYTDTDNDTDIRFPRFTVFTLLTHSLTHSLTDLYLFYLMVFTYELTSSYDYDC